MVSVRRVLSSLAVVVVGSLLWVTQVRAEAAALLPVVAEAAVLDREVLAAQQAIVTYFAQLPDPVPLSPPEDALPRAGNQFRNCREAACAGEFARVLSVDFTVVVRIFSGDRRGERGSVSVALVTPDGTAYSGNVEVHEGGVHAATQQAADFAYDRLNRGPGPWLKVDGPDGARVRVDAASPHPLPYLEKHEHGLHRIVVESAQGDVLLDTTVNLPDDPAHYEVVTAEANAAAIASEASAGAKPDSPSYWQRPRSVWNYVIGIPLVVAGIVYGVAGAVHYAKSGECANDDCTRKYAVKPISKVELGLGIAGVALGGVIMGVGIVRESPGTSAAVVSARGTF